MQECPHLQFWEHAEPLCLHGHDTLTHDLQEQPLHAFSHLQNSEHAKLFSLHGHVSSIQDVQEQAVLQGFLHDSPHLQYSIQAESFCLQGHVTLTHDVQELQGSGISNGLCGGSRNVPDWRKKAVISKVFWIQNVHHISER